MCCVMFSIKLFILAFKYLYNNIECGENIFENKIFSIDIYHHIFIDSTKITIKKLKKHKLS